MTIETRIAALEQESRRSRKAAQLWLFTSLNLGLILTIVVFAGANRATQDDALRGKSLVLTDASGKVTWELKVDTSGRLMRGGSSLVLMDGSNEVGAFSSALGPHHDVSFTLGENAGAQVVLDVDTNNEDKSNPAPKVKCLQNKKVRALLGVEQLSPVMKLDSEENSVALTAENGSEPKMQLRAGQQSDDGADPVSWSIAARRGKDDGELAFAMNGQKDVAVLSRWLSDGASSHAARLEIASEQGVATLGFEHHGRGQHSPVLDLRSTRPGVAVSDGVHLGVNLEGSALSLRNGESNADIRVESSVTLKLSELGQSVFAKP